MSVHQFVAALGSAVALLGAAQEQPAIAPRGIEPALTSGRALAQVIDPRAASAASAAAMPQRNALLDAAEQALARGETSAAILGFDRAAMMLHSADTEMGLVRAWMQAGDYRRALAFCAHTAGAHRDTPAAGALYAWLLRVGGQEAFAARVLGETLLRAPHDAVASAASRAFDTRSPSASGVLLNPPHRMAPQASLPGGQSPLPHDAKMVSSGVLVGDGRHALVPSTSIENTRRLWVRNGLGRTTEAAIETVPDLLRAPGFTLLRLAAPLDPADVPLAPRDPFAGSPGFVVGYTAAPDAVPSWPWLQQGFFGAFDGPGGMRKLGFALAAGSEGAPVFDASGRLAAITVRGAQGQASMLPVSMFRALVAQTPAAAAPAPTASAEAASRMPADEAYERALKIALQVIALP